MNEQIVTVQAAPHSCEIARNASGGVSFSVKIYHADPEDAMRQAKALFSLLDSDYPVLRK